MLINLSSVSRLALSAPDAVSGANAPAPVAPAKAADKRGKAGKASKPVSGATNADLKPFIRENRNLARDAVTVTRAATNFGEITDRDAAYRLFFGSIMRVNGKHSATLREIFDAGRKADGKSYNPHYAGSAKATDAGAINRAVKAGYFTVSENGKRLTATAKAKADAAYNGKA